MVMSSYRLLCQRLFGRASLSVWAAEYSPLLTLFIDWLLGPNHCKKELEDAENGDGTNRRETGRLDSSGSDRSGELRAGELDSIERVGPPDVVRADANSGQDNPSRGPRPETVVQERIAMDRKVFFDHIRKPLTWRTWKAPRINPFNHKFMGFQVKGLDAILDEAERRDWDTRWTAYALATAYWETARTLTPIREYGRGKGREYGRKDPHTGQAYYGRGLVQLTWLFNYKKAKKYLGIDFVNNPDLALNPSHATAIMFSGMEDGWFTGKKLSGYFNDKKTDWRGARRIINGLDRATQIAGYARVFHAALKVANSGEKS